MDIGLRRGETPDSYEQEYLAWLENHVRDLPTLDAIDLGIRTNNPVLYRIISEAAAELAPYDPKGHATYFGSLHLLANKMHLQKVGLN